MSHLKRVETPLRLAATLQTASLVGSIGFMKFMLCVRSKYAETHQDTPAKQQLSFHKTSAAVQTGAQNEPTNSPVRNQWEQQTQLWRSDGGPGMGGSLGGRSSSEVVVGGKDSWKHQLCRLFWGLNVASVVTAEPDWLLWRRSHRQVRLVGLIKPNQGLILGEGGRSRRQINRYFCKQSCD